MRGRIARPAHLEIQKTNLKTESIRQPEFTHLTQLLYTPLKKDFYNFQNYAQSQRYSYSTLMKKTNSLFASHQTSLTLRNSLDSHSGLDFPFQFPPKKDFISILTAETITRILEKKSITINEDLDAKINALSEKNANDFICILSHLKKWNLVNQNNIEQFLSIISVNLEYKDFTIAGINYLLGERAKIEKPVTQKEMDWLITFLTKCPPLPSGAAHRMIRETYLSVIANGITMSNYLDLQEILKEEENGVYHYQKLIWELTEILPQTELQSFLLYSWSDKKLEHHHTVDLAFKSKDDDIQPLLNIFKDMEEMKVLTPSNVENILKLKNELNISDEDKNFFYDRAKLLFRERTGIFSARNQPMSPREFNFVVYFLKNFPSPSSYRHEEIKELYLSMVVEGLTLLNCAQVFELKNAKSLYAPYEKIANELERLFPKPKPSFFKAKKPEEEVQHAPAPEEKIIPGIS